MGSGRWSVANYTDRVTAKAAAGVDVFDYSRSAIQSGVLRPHQTLDPSGLGMRESRDSAEHPNSNAIIISLDVTGSMGRVCRGIHDDLPHLFELLLGHHYIADPQILFAAIGDATCDRVPLQVGQFESDNRMDLNLENMILEGGGGGQKTESYELMFYIAARHTAIDCFEKRGRKGYLFMIGDEMAYPAVKKIEVGTLIGSAPPQDIPVAEIIAEAKAKYHVYYIIPGGASYGADRQVEDYWNDLLGPDRVIKLQSPQDTSECIGMAIGVNEGTVSVADAVNNMQQRGVVTRTIDAVSRALGSLVPKSISDALDERARRL